MKVGLAFASSAAIDGPATIEICRRAEEVGFESLWGGEHVIIPDEIHSKYPYTEMGKYRQSRIHQYLPFDMAGFCGCCSAKPPARYLYFDCSTAQSPGACKRTGHVRSVIRRAS